MNEVSEGAVVFILGGYCLRMARDGSFGPDTSVEQPLETAQGRAGKCAVGENRTRRTESDYGIYLCAIHARTICQTTPYSQTRKCPGGKNLTGQTRFDQTWDRGGRV